ncbi:helix-turn-helix domain-containing protein, partial [Candidatus Zixiibacteriota bacterium]
QRRLAKHDWPGNVRELQHAVERAVIMSERDALQLQDFFLADPETRKTGVLLESFNLTEVEKGVIRKAISKHGGNLSRAAEELGLTRTSLYRRIQKYDL